MNAPLKAPGACTSPPHTHTRTRTRARAHTHTQTHKNAPSPPSLPPDGSLLIRRLPHPDGPSALTVDYVKGGISLVREPSLPFGVIKMSRCVCGGGEGWQHCVGKRPPPYKSRCRRVETWIKRSGA
jgi:hypothetical protein